MPVLQSFYKRFPTAKHCAKKDIRHIFRYGQLILSVIVFYNVVLVVCKQSQRIKKQREFHYVG